jgi:phosphatidate cytidylyltransferase
MDCQFIMGFFAYMYYHSFIAVYKASVGDIIEAAINGLTVEEQFEVVRGLGKYLYNQGTVSETVCSIVFDKNGPPAHKSYRYWIALTAS